MSPPANLPACSTLQRVAALVPVVPKLSTENVTKKTLLNSNPVRGTTQSAGFTKRMNNRARKLIFTGVFLVSGSWITLFLIVLGQLTVPFLVNLLLYVTSVSGMFFGFLGAGNYLRRTRNREDRDDLNG